MKLRNYRGYALSFLSVLFMLSNLHVLAVNVNPKPVKDLLERIGGEGAARRFVTVVDEDLAENGNDVFVLTSQQDKPCIKGSSEYILLCEEFPVCCQAFQGRRKIFILAV